MTLLFGLLKPVYREGAFAERSRPVDKPKKRWRKRVLHTIAKAPSFTGISTTNIARLLKFREEQASAVQQVVAENAQKLQIMMKMMKQRKRRQEEEALLLAIAQYDD